MLVTLDRLASRYHTDPASVLAWDPFRLALAVACLDQADATRSTLIQRADGVLPVIDLGRV